MFGLTILLLCSLLFSASVKATTEWFGDLRARLYPPNPPPFYDVAYEDTEACPFGLRSNAVPGYVYFGEMISTLAVKKHTDCLLECLITEGCKAVNYFEPVDRSKNAAGFCEVLKEEQRDNPILMRRFSKSVYFEHVHCIADEGQDQVLNMPRHRFQPTHARLVSNNQSPSAAADVLPPVPETKENTEGRNTTLEKAQEAGEVSHTTPIQTNQGHPSEVVGPSIIVIAPQGEREAAMALYKKLAAKVREYSARFASKR